MVDPFIKIVYFVPFKVETKKTENLVRLFIYEY